MIIATGLLLGLLTLGFWSIYRYTMGLTTVGIEGNSFVSHEEIVALLSPYQSRNALALSAFGIVNRRLEKANHKIESVTTDYKWPTGLRVTIKEKKPWVTFSTQDKSVTVAEDGTILSRGQYVAEDEFSKNGLIIRNISPSYISSKSINPYLINNLTPIVRLIRTFFPDQSLQLELRGLTLSESGCVFNEVVIVKDDTIPIYMGTDSHLQEKLERLQQYLRHYDEVEAQAEQPRSIQYIDVRVPNKIIVNYGARL